MGPMYRASEQFSDASQYAQHAQQHKQPHNRHARPFVCVCIYIQMHWAMRVHARVSECVYAWLLVCKDMRTHPLVFACVCTHKLTYFRRRLAECTRPVCIHTRRSTTITHKRPCVSLYACKLTHVRTQTQTCGYIYVCVCIHRYMHVCG